MRSHHPLRLLPRIEGQRTLPASVIATTFHVPSRALSSFFTSASSPVIAVNGVARRAMAASIIHFMTRRPESVSRRTMVGLHINRLARETHCKDHSSAVKTVSSLRFGGVQLQNPWKGHASGCPSSRAEIAVRTRNVGQKNDLATITRGFRPRLV